MKKTLTILLTSVLVIVIACAITLGIMLNSSYNKITITQSQLSSTQLQLSSTQSQLSDTQDKLSSFEANSPSIDFVIYPVLANGAGYTTTPSLSGGIPIITPGDEIIIYGAGFLVGENISFQISDGNVSFNIGTTTVVDTAGVFYWVAYANWNNYQWAQNGARFSSVTAMGDKGSKAAVFVEIGTE